MLKYYVREFEYLKSFFKFNIETPENANYNKLSLQNWSCKARAHTVTAECPKGTSL